MSTLSISSTGLSDAATCLAKYRYHLVDHLISRPENISKPIRRGIWLHRCLQDHHCGRDWQKSLARLMGQALEWKLDADAMQEIYDECRLLMLSYVGFWRDDNWKIVADEQEYRATFGDVELRATIDTAVRIPGHGLVIVEHKSTSDIPPAAWRAVDPQTALQIILMGANGLRVDEVLFNYIDTSPKVPRVTEKRAFHASTGVTTTAHFDQAAAELDAKIRRFAADLSAPATVFDPDYETYVKDKRAEYVNDEKFFQRYYVKREPALLRETLLDVRGLVDRIQRAEAMGHYPRSLNVFTCKSCFYNHAALCPTEYVKGAPSEVLRTEQFQLDTGYREGNVV